MNYLMMQKSELEDLRRRAKRGWIMFAVGALTLVVSAFNVGRYSGHRDSAAKLEALQIQQVMQTHYLESVWTEQRAEREMLKSAAEAIKDRDGLVGYNEEHWCPRTPQAAAAAARAATAKK